MIQVNMNTVVIKISQASAVTKTVLGGQTIHSPVANFLQCNMHMCQKL